MCVHLHVDVRRLEAALIDVVVREGLRWVGAVLVHRDGHFSMSHALRRVDMRCGSVHLDAAAAAAARRTPFILQGPT